MTNTELREKLVALLMEKGFGVEGANIASDHLISNGVTLNQWIPVAERLPEENGEYIISFLYNGVKMNELVAKSVWINSESLTPEEREKFPLGCFLAQSMSAKVTHWMPLPSLPKEE